MQSKHETLNEREEGTMVYIISKCWHDVDGTILSTPIMGLNGELNNPDQVAAYVTALNTLEEAKVGVEASFFYSYRPYPRQLIDDFPF